MNVTKIDIKIPIYITFCTYIFSVSSYFEKLMLLQAVSAVAAAVAADTADAAAGFVATMYRIIMFNYDILPNIVL